MKLRSLALGASLALFSAAGCDAKIATVLENPSTPGEGADGGLQDEDRPLVPASKVDLLLVVDNSAGMEDKSSRLATSIGTLLRNVATTGDVHVGVISSSLGNFGGDVCPTGNPETNGHAYLRTKGPNGAAVPGAESGVLAYTGGDVDTFVASTEALIRGVGGNGCGLEAQLESMYRFLIQPDPWTDVRLDGSARADLGADVDVQVLLQRKAFLRPDSALVIVMITDEDDSAVDPLSVGGQGWAFMAKSFPGSQVYRAGQGLGTTAPRGTSICSTDPGNPSCTSCGYQSLCDPTDARCQAIRTDRNCTTSPVPGRSGPGYDGYYGPSDDDLNVRFHRMKERYGVDPQYPLSRYVDGLTRSVVPSRVFEHRKEVPGDTSSPSTFTKTDEYVGTPSCTNPIFAATLPSAVGDELCRVPRGPRSRELVLFAVLGGLPTALATDTPDWTKILGRDPGKFDFDGIDPHMIQSIEPRPGLPGPTSSATDREWDTEKSDLQFACTFALAAPRTCEAADPSCACPPESTTSSPLCSAPGQQIRAKAYPTPRPLRVVRDLGARGIVGSVCADSYDETMTLIAQRLAPRLAH